MVIAALAAAGVGLALPLKDRGVRERWRRLAERLGLRFQPGRLLESDGMEGHLGPYPVRVDNQRRQGTRVSVSLQAAGRLRVQPRHLWFFEAGERTDDHLEDADARVAHLIRQIGLARLFLILLDAENEARLDAGIYSAHVSIDRGEVAFTSPERIDDPEVLGAVLGGLARLAESLESTDRMAERLSENARSVAATTRRKLACLSLLLEHLPKSTECGRATWSIVKAPATHTPDGLRLRLLALRHLDATQPQAELLAAIDDALCRPSPALRVVAAEALLALPPEQAVPRILEAARDPSAHVAVTALRVLPLRSTPADLRVEKLLLDLLYRGDMETRVDVVCALARLGTARCIGPLLDLDRVADPGVRRVCRHALARLQARYPERQSGSLSLIESGGELSLPNPDSKDRAD